MGWLISSLADLPVDNEVNWYIFVVAEGWHSDGYELIEQNFTHIAKRLGTHAVIVKGLNEELFTRELCEKYIGKDYFELSNLMPALMITDTRPENLNEDSMRILVSLNEVNAKFKNPDFFFASIIRFARNEGAEFLDYLETKENYFKSLAGMLELKPNFCGVGINLNAIIDYFASRKT